MVKLILCITAFGLVHLLPAIPLLKTKAVGLLGKAYGPIYGVLSLALLAVAIWAFRQTTPTSLYDVPAWGRYANFGFSLLGFVCVGIFLFRGSWRNVLRYPMGLGVVLWATGHLLANGDVATTVLFGGLALFAALHIVLKWLVGPFIATDVRPGHNLLSVIAGIAVYGIMTQLHYAIAGVGLVQLS